jgi:hypothetical protein
MNPQMVLDKIFPAVSSSGRLSPEEQAASRHSLDQALDMQPFVKLLHRFQVALLLCFQVALADTVWHSLGQALDMQPSARLLHCFHIALLHCFQVALLHCFQVALLHHFQVALLHCFQVALAETVCRESTDMGTKPLELRQMKACRK